MSVQAAPRTPSPAQLFGRKPKTQSSAPATVPVSTSTVRPKDTSFRIPEETVRGMYERLMTAVRADQELEDRIRKLRDQYVWVFDFRWGSKPLRDIYAAVASLQGVQGLLRRERGINARWRRDEQVQRPPKSQKDIEADRVGQRNALECKRLWLLKQEYFVSSVSGDDRRCLLTPVPKDADEIALRVIESVLWRLEGMLEKFEEQAEAARTSGPSKSTRRRQLEQLAKKRARTAKLTADGGTQERGGKSGKSKKGK